MNSISKLCEPNNEISKNLCRFCGEQNKNLNIDDSWNVTFFDITKKLFSLTVEMLSGLKICIDCIIVLESICKFYNQVKYVSQIFSEAENSIKKQTRTIPPTNIRLNSECAVENEEVNNLSEDVIENVTEIIEIENNVFCEEEISKIDDNPDNLNKIKMELHQESHRFDKEKKARSYKCPVCNKIYRLKKFFDEHIKEYSDQNPVVCNICDQEFGTKCLLRLHKKRGSSYECKVCSKKFLNHFRLSIHRKLHWSAEEQEENLHKCPHCDKKFRLQYSCRYHIQSKHPTEYLNVKFVFKCKICNLEFRTNYHVNKHKEKTHGKKVVICPSKRSCECEICGKPLSSRQALKEHKKLHLSAQEAERQAAIFFKCPHCELKYPNKATMLNHVQRQHLNQKTICETCGKEFANNWSLKLHLANKHISLHQRLLECDICGKKISGYYNCLRNHKKIYHEKPLLKCVICDKYFPTYLSLKQHKKSHFPEQNQTQLNNRLKKKKAALKHVHSKINEKKSICRICDRTFTYKQNLQNHLKWNHILKLKT